MRIAEELHAVSSVVSTESVDAVCDAPHFLYKRTGLSVSKLLSDIVSQNTGESQPYETDHVDGYM